MKLMSYSITEIGSKWLLRTKFRNQRIIEYVCVWLYVYVVCGMRSFESMIHNTRQRLDMTIPKRHEGEGSRATVQSYCLSVCGV